MTLYSDLMFPAQPGVVARYGSRDLKQEGTLLSQQNSRPVVAFTDDGAPMVIGDEQAGHARNLVRADTYPNYLGMSYNPIIVGPLGLHKDLPEDNQLGAESSEYRTVANMTQWEIAAVDFAALRALELAGKRQLTSSRRGWRSELKEVPTWEIHTRIQIDDVDRALTGAYDILQTSLPGHADVYRAIDCYVRERIRSQRLHDTRKLLTVLAESGCLARLNYANPS